MGGGMVAVAWANGRASLDFVFERGDGDVEAVEELLERGVDVNLQDDALKGERNSAVVCSGGGAQDNRVSTSPCPESRAGGVRGGGPNRSWPSGLLAVTSHS